MSPASTPHAAPSAPGGKAGSAGPAWIVVLLSGAAFVGASLWPWRQLVNGDYLLRFCGFAAALCAVVLVLAAIVSRLRRRGPASATLAAAVSLAVLVPVWACNRRPDIDVILLHLDSLRADHCSAYGYERETTPRLAEFARRRGVRFTRFFSQSAGTDKSTPAYLCSIYPSMFCDPATEGPLFAVPARFPLLSEYLARAGWRCWGFSSNPQVNAQRGYERGFEALETWWKPSPRPHELMARLRAHLEASTAGRNFVFGLVLDPHMPYTPGPAFDLWSQPGTPDYATLQSLHRDRGVAGEALIGAVIDLYDGEIREVDAALGELLGWLESSGRVERTLVVVTADHGEKFLEHGEFGHGGLLYDDVTHIPLVASFPSPLRFPRLVPVLADYEGLASHVDLLPTILGFVGAPARDAHIRGRDLVPFLYGRQPVPEGEVYIEELVDDTFARALRTPTHKALWFKRQDEPEQQVLFDLVADPDELSPAGEGEPSGRLAALRREIDRYLAESRRFYRREEAEPLDEATRQALEELGYAH